MKGEISTEVWSGDIGADGLVILAWVGNRWMHTGLSWLMIGCRARLLGTLYGVPGFHTKRRMLGLLGNHQFLRPS
jgi:hypothetical protein